MDEKNTKIRGKRANFSEAVDKILELLEYKKKNNLKTILVPCMNDLAMEKTDVKMHKDFLKFWKDKDVFAYIKPR